MKAIIVLSSFCITITITRIVLFYDGGLASKDYYVNLFSTDKQRQITV